MTTVNVSLPKDLKEFVDAQASTSGYGDASEYLRALILQEQKRKARETLEAKLLEGLRSESSPMTAEDWEDIRREGLQRIADQKHE